MADVNRPVDSTNPGYYRSQRGPWVGSRLLECIEVIRWITDMRLATAMKYIWRVAFGGKEKDREDIEKAMWYLQDWLDHPLTPPQEP